jgi:hypothetical protein
MGGERPVHGQNHQQVESRRGEWALTGERMIFRRFIDMIGTHGR